MPLIKHDIKLYPEQKIDTIEVDKIENSFYDQMVFAKLENLALTIKKFSKTDKPALLLHLPYWDYILFGLDLFIRGKLTLSAFDSLITQVYLRKEIYLEKINEICDKHEIAVTIKSPFASLFQSLDIAKLILSQEEKLSQLLATQKKPSLQEEPIIAQNLLEILGLAKDEKFYTKFNPPQPKTVKNWESQLKLQLKLQSELKQIINDFIKKCLDKLQDAKLNPESYQVWQDLCKMQQAKFNKKFEREKFEWQKKLSQQKLISDESSEELYEPELEQLDNLECLLHMANASLLMEGARGKAAYETCSLLEISEKQIPATYADLVDNYSKDLAEAYGIEKQESKYAPVVNLTTMEACFAYKAQNTSGLLFYFSTNNTPGLAAIFADRNVLSAIGQNIYSQIARTRTPQSVTEVLPAPEITLGASPRKSGQPSNSCNSEKNSLKKLSIFPALDKREEIDSLPEHNSRSLGDVTYKFNS